MSCNVLHPQCWQQARWIGAGGARNMHSGATVRKKAQIGLHASRPPRLAGVGEGREGGAFRQFSSEQRRGWRDRTIGCQ